MEQQIFAVIDTNVLVSALLSHNVDRVFYEVSLTGDSYLVTGNLKHFPSTPKVVTPAEMMRIINEL